MKYLFLLISFCIVLVAKSSNIVVSILPEKSIVEAISDKNIKVFVVVPPGSEPHTFEPKPSIMKEIAKADIYFAIGVEFENSWLFKFKSQNKKLKIIYLDKNITKINNNPHIWLSLNNLKIIAKTIYETLNDINLKKNYDKYIKKIETCDKDIKNILKYKKNKTFMTFHPAFTYFAKDYNLTQLSIEKNGKEPSLKELLQILKRAKQNGIKNIITSPEFSDKSAKIISNELHIKVIKISPLNPNICQTLKEVANSL